MTGGEPWNVSYFQGVMINKGPYALFSYAKEFLHRETRTVLETGTQTGGSALWFAVASGVRVVTYDVRPERVEDAARHPLVEFRGESLSSSTEHEAGGVSVSLDSDHSAGHIEAELRRFAPLVSLGQILVVEDVLEEPGVQEMLDEWEVEHGSFKRFEVPLVSNFRWYERVE